MPFISLSPTGHGCLLPVSRPNGALLRPGDMWQCDEQIGDPELGVRECGKVWEFVDPNNDGGQWELSGEVESNAVH